MPEMKIAVSAMTENPSSMNMNVFTKTSIGLSNIDRDFTAATTAKTMIDTMTPPVIRRSIGLISRGGDFSAAMIAVVAAAAAAPADPGGMSDSLWLLA
jgi:hypothetical protein